MCPDEGTWRLAGIGSWGRIGCDPRPPSVSTRIPGFVDWINGKTGKYLYK